MNQSPTKRGKASPLPQDVVSWYDLSPELIARMSKFIDIGRDLTGLCVVVGSDTAALVRRAYLTDNDAYLAQALYSMRGNKLRIVCVSAARRIRFWMAVNTNWRDRCDKVSFENLEVLHHRSIVVPVECIFTSPTVATFLGLVEIVETLVDKGLFGCHDFLPLIEAGPEVHVSLICLCLTRSIDNSVLRYLLSRDDFDPNAPWLGDIPHCSPLHLASRAVNADPEALKMIIDHPICSSDNVAGNGPGGTSPLHDLCSQTSDKRYAVRKMKILLGAGANPELRDVGGRTPRDYLMERLSNAGTEEDIDLTTELLATLQKAILARRL
mmetsp:Transcript_29519/g.65035  ORF Transcript_29519/g.65035 Transcript_29519/m.65035 type:complete len:325 (-) Transcript_29519:223-1197(-)|eukprot:CAMPEP_0178523792 /NCGR_PEP_ID=MMETSP0696-20121128/29294_1 /TAXON_ID=265572 /ORGANISM="Extubocellulus spinifer, Strain CCMP396" /LENGTH=324 /DNA_ID=CAMNT_0020155075 /DNA_START=185 /DNA_END=1159 /DNA_ORIENTATION=+